MDKIAERLNDGCIRILQLVYIHLLWCVFTLLGLIVLGIGPATFAMYTVIRQWIRGNTDIRIFPTFWKAYRSHFKESAVIGVLYQLVGLILYVDLLYVDSFFVRALLFVVSFLFFVSILYIFPIMVHYEWKSFVLKIKSSLLFGIAYLQYTLMLMAALAVVYFILLMYPGVLMTFGLSIGCYMTMWLTHSVFLRIEMQAGPKKELKGGEQAKGLMKS